MRKPYSLVADTAEKAFGLDRGAVWLRSNEPEIATARRLTWWVLQRHYGYSQSRLARIWGKHHTTVRTGVMLIEARFADERLAQSQAEVEEALGLPVTRPSRG